MEIAFIIAVFLGLALGFVIAKKPSEFCVSREALIPASPAEIFPYINNLQAWQTWSPWARMDPEAKGTSEGPIEGIGAKFSWEGKKTGKGSMTVMQSRPDEFVQFKLEFIKPMAATNLAEFTLTPAGNNQTRVNWTMYGPNTFAGKCLSLFIDCEKMCQEQFGQGFENLKQVLEDRKKAA